MKKELAIKLKEQAEELAKRFSDHNRAGNTNEETFVVVGIVPKSDHVATITYSKSSGKMAYAIALWINGYNSWTIFFPDLNRLRVIGKGKMLCRIRDHFFIGLRKRQKKSKSEERVILGKMDSFYLLLATAVFFLGVSICSCLCFRCRI